MRRVIDTDALDLRYSTRAMVLHVQGSVVRLADPRREPSAGLAAVGAPIGSLRDKAALAAYAAAVGYLPSGVLSIAGAGRFGDRALWAGIAGDSERLRHLADSVRAAATSLRTGRRGRGSGTQLVNCRRS